MADSKITDLPFYDPLNIDIDDTLVIVDIAKDETNKVTLEDLNSIFKEFDLELSKSELAELSSNRDTASGISWIINPQIFKANYLPNSNILPRTDIITTEQPFTSPFKLKFKPYTCCKDKWPSIPHVVLKPGVPSPQYHGLMTLRYCSGIIATVTFSRSYLGEPFIFTDENGIDITHFNNGERLRFTDGLVQL